MNDKIKHGCVQHQENEAEQLLLCEARHCYQQFKENGPLWWKNKKERLIKIRGNINPLLNEMEKLRLLEKNNQ